MTERASCWTGRACVFRCGAAALTGARTVYNPIPIYMGDTSEGTARGAASCCISPSKRRRACGRCWRWCGRACLLTVRSPGACIIRGRIKPVEKARRKKAPGEGRRRESRASLQGKVRAVRQMPKKWAVAAPAGACRSAAEPPVRMPRRERGPFVRRCFFHSKCPAAFRRADAGVCRAKRRTKTAVRGEGGRKTCL